MKFDTWLVLFSMCFLSNFANAITTEADAKSDYEHIPQTNGYYKFYSTGKNFYDAMAICEREDAILFYPKTETESKTVITFFKTKMAESFPKHILLGMSVIKNGFETVDGIPIADVYIKWTPGEPNNPGSENCVEILDSVAMNNIPCSDAFPFICKSKKVYVWNEQCHTASSDYVYSEQLGKCYKLHLRPETWAEAQKKCRAERSQLAVINSHEEAAYFARLTQKALSNIPGRFTHGVVLLGFHNNNVEDWQTIEGTSLYYSGYACWGNSQPDSGERDRCGSMFYNGHLNDINCAQKAYFICEHDNVAVDYVREPRSFYTVIQSVQCHDTI